MATTENTVILDQILQLLAGGERMLASEIAEELGQSTQKVSQIMARWGAEKGVAHFGLEKGRRYWGIKTSVPRQEKRTDSIVMAPNFEEYSEEYLRQKRDERLLHFRKHYSPARRA